MEWYWIVALILSGVGIGILLTYVVVMIYLLKNPPFG